MECVTYQLRRLLLSDVRKERGWFRRLQFCEEARSHEVKSRNSYMQPVRHSGRAAFSFRQEDYPGARATAFDCQHSHSGICPRVRVVAFFCAGYVGGVGLTRMASQMPRGIAGWSEREPCVAEIRRQNGQCDGARSTTGPSHVRAGLPPVLTILGDQDDVVPCGCVQPFTTQAFPTG